MPGLDLVAFLIGTVVMVAVPGPAIVFAVTRTLELGRAAGLVSVAGLETGLVTHVALAAGGLSAILASSPTSMHALRLLGAAYLLALAVQAYRHRERSDAVRHVTADASAAQATASLAASRPVALAGATTWRLFCGGFLVDLLNPKTGLFFLAFCPNSFTQPWPTRGSCSCWSASASLPLHRFTTAVGSSSQPSWPAAERAHPP